MIDMYVSLPFETRHIFTCHPGWRHILGTSLCFRSVVALTGLTGRLLIKCFGPRLSKSCTLSWKRRPKNSSSLSFRILKIFILTLDSRSQSVVRFLLESLTTGKCGSTVGSTMLKLLYDYDAKSQEDRFLSLANQIMAIVDRSMLPGARLVNDFPLRACSRDLHINCL
jgi:hypothetical protein